MRGGFLLVSTSQSAVGKETFLKHATRAAAKGRLSNAMPMSAAGKGEKMTTGTDDHGARWKLMWGHHAVQ